MSDPVVDLERGWPLAEPYPETGYRLPLGRVSLTDGTPVRISAWGDAVGGGYNGGFALLSQSDELLGTLEYQSTPHEVLIAMVEVPSAQRRRGIADVLLMRLRAEFPDQPIRAGYTTPDGERWWARVRHAVEAG